ncbi:lipase family protein [Rhodococcus sp. T7]|uniref:lipase family protein n=1 Tax=Rhodococcus sp. T7 TaxID=627444 RepID=UPI001357BD5D|nr:lipase family protein [Rhodococcus sp. T7]KAF0966506.1 putative inactive lipase [Rhodococcus sp. T7]
MKRSRITSLTASALCAAFVACAAIANAGVAAALPIYPASDPDPFYGQPQGLAEAAVGEPLAVRPMPPLLAFPDTDVWQVKYRTTNSEDHPIASVTTVLVPRNRPVNGPLLSYQHIINALGPGCAPSRTLYSNDPDLQIKEAPALNLALQRGWTVALPDHLGPNSAYGAARLGGTITLDGIRAVQRVPELAVAESPVALAGYSGGGMASAWAAALAPTYAPELNIVGVAEGGVPMNIGKMANGLGMQPHPAFGLAMAAALGLEREYPDKLPISEQLNDRGLAMRDEMVNACTNGILAAGAGRSATEVAKTTDLMSSPQAWEVLNENSVELYPGVPTAPIFEWHSPTDVLIPVDSIEATIARYCAAGAKVQSDLFPSPDHLTTAVLGLPTALDYLDARFRGDPAPSNC